MISVISSVLSGTMYLIFDKETIEEQELTEGMTIGLKILGITRKNSYSERNIYFRRELKHYTNTSLKMSIPKKFAEALGLEDGDLVNMEITKKE
ncbi:MAG: hypothetical protein GF364_14570 [Candidatus Lokiarchaeota archaeon]|nr:hypothetical protein [Candidatus Lokiarchaeota archaeon]